MATLYRKYRPQLWKDVTDQNHIKITLQKELETGKIAHAYLFSGPRGVGKTTMARLLAKSLNCEQRKEGESEPCNKCSSCQEIANDRSIDVLEIDAASNTGVDNVRENIIDASRFLPTKSKYKIYIIDEAHMLSTAAFNALLKTMEEPPPYVFFILATTESHKLPATIVSRCQKFEFKKIQLLHIVERLKNIAEQEKFSVDKKVLDRIAHQSEGCLRDAESLLGQIMSLGDKKITEAEADLVLPRSDTHEVIQLVELIAAKNAREGIVMINKLVEQGVDLSQFANDLLYILRLLLLTKISGDAASLGQELEDEFLKKLQSLARECATERIVEMIETVMKQKLLLKSSPIPQLPLEMAVVTLCESAELFCSPPSAAPQPPGLKKITVQPSTIDTPEVMEAEIALDPDQPVIVITLEEVQKKWPMFLKKVQEYNHSLPLILKMGEPLELCGNVIKVGFKYSFHRDKMNEPRVRTLAEKALNEIFKGCKLCLEALLHKTDIDKTPESGNNDVVQNILQAFGGQVVE